MAMTDQFLEIMTRDFLVHEYQKSGRSATSIAAEIGCSTPTVIRYLKREGIHQKRSLRRGDLSGQEFNFLTAIKKVPCGADRKTRWVCRCRCGNEIVVLVKRLFNNKTKSCGCLLRGPQSDRYQGTPHISKSYWGSLCRSARDRGLKFSITIQEAEKIFLDQNGMCALSGIFLVPHTGRGSSKKWTASLDRKNSFDGYTTDNVQWVHKDINRMKWHYDQDYFIELCEAVSSHAKAGMDDN